MNRKKSYKKLANILKLTSIINAILNVTIGLIAHSALLLLLNLLISKFISTIYIIKDFLIYIRKEIPRNIIYKNFNQFRDMLFYSTPSELLQSINRNILTIYLTSYFDPAIAGGYFLMQRVFGGPISIFSSSFSQVFFEKFTNTENKYQLLYLTWLKIAAISLPLGILLFIIIKPIVLFIFGSTWIIASDIALILLPYFVIYSIFASTSRSHITLRLQHISLTFTIINFLVRILIMYYGVKTQDGMMVMKLFVIYDILQMILMNLIVLKKAKVFNNI